MPIYCTQIDPLDPLLFGDSRSARAGSDHLQMDQNPSPLTLHGALGQLVLDRSGGWPCPALGRRQENVLDPEGKIAELLGYCHRTPSGSLLFPRPRHLRCRLDSQGRPEPIDLLTPNQPGGAEVSSRPELSELLLPRQELGEIEEHEGEILIGEHVLAEILCGREPSGDVGLWLEQDVFRAEPRPGIAVDNSTGSVFEGAFFTRPYRRFRPAPLDPRSTGAAGFVAWLSTLAPIDPGKSPIGFLGGDRRRARFAFEEAGSKPSDVLPGVLAQVAQAAESEPTRGFFVYLLTPAIQDASDCTVEGQTPLAAARGKAVHVSGWDVRQRRPRPMLTLVPAGSVFFFPWPQNTARGELIRRRWLEPIKKTGAAAGFGRGLVGVWR